MRCVHATNVRAAVQAARNSYCSRAIGAIAARFEPGPIEDGNHAPACPDKPGILEDTESHGHTRTPHAQHGGQELVRKKHLVAVDPVVSHQKPARQSFFDLAAPVRQCGTRGLDRKCVAVLQEGAMETGAALDGVTQIGGLRRSGLNSEQW